MKSITIIGGGLAGLSLGIALRRHGVPVTVREAGRYPRHRVCGEFICGVPEATLERLGVAELLGGSALNRSTSWHRGNRRIFRADLPIPARGISRYRLDNRLAQRLEATGGILRTADRAGGDTFYSEGTVTATGRGKGRSDWMALKIHLRDFRGLLEDLEMHLGDGAYVGVSRIEEGLVNLCGLFRRLPGLRATREELLFRYIEASGLPLLAERGRAAVTLPESFAASSGFDFPRGYHVDTSRLCIGDAAGMIPPFTGNGMSLALENAEIALAPVLAYARGQTDWTTACSHSSHAARRRFHSRLRTANQVHGFLTDKKRRDLALALASIRLLPFRTLFRLLH